MRNLISLIFLLTILSCNSDTTQKVEHSNPLTNPCEVGRDTINIETVFTKDTSSFPTQRFYSVVDFIKSKGLFKPDAEKTDKLKIEKEYSKTYPVAYDTCNHNIDHLKTNGHFIIGYVIMPNHVHVILAFPRIAQVSTPLNSRKAGARMKQRKERCLLVPCYQRHLI